MQDLAGADRHLGKDRRRRERRSCHEERLAQRHAREHREDQPRSRRAQQHSRDQRSQHGAGALRERRHGVGRRELGRAVGQAREDRGLCRMDEHEAHGVDDGGSKDQPERRLGEKDHRHGAERDGLHQIGDEKDAVAPEMVRGEGTERRDQSGGHQLHRGDERHGARSAPLVAVHQDRDPAGVLRHVVAEVGQLDPQHLRVARDLTDDADPFVHEVTIQTSVIRPPPSSRVRRSVSLRRRSTPSARIRWATWCRRRGSPCR